MSCKDARKGAACPQGARPPQSQRGEDVGRKCLWARLCHRFHVTSILPSQPTLFLAHCTKQIRAPKLVEFVVRPPERILKAQGAELQEAVLQGPAVVECVDEVEQHPKPCRRPRAVCANGCRGPEEELREDGVCVDGVGGHAQSEGQLEDRPARRDGPAGEEAQAEARPCRADLQLGGSQIEARHVLGPTGECRQLPSLRGRVAVLLWLRSHASAFRVAAHIAARTHRAGNHLGDP
mmetsp:Transcript_69781/g.226954  ORF Transcript_69781/g.226954 Transcript_69781/m.226954 type:complete len:236 (-) Transcript_69781:36-743(-)